MKYELTDETKVFAGATVLHRIRALIDIPRYGIKAGDLGGFIEGEENLSQEGSCWITSNARVTQRGSVRDNALVSEGAWVNGNAILRDNCMARGNSRINGDARMRDRAVAEGDCSISGDALVGGSAIVKDKAILRGGTIYGSSVLCGTVLVDGLPTVPQGEYSSGGILSIRIMPYTITAIKPNLMVIDSRSPQTFKMFELPIFEDEQRAEEILHQEGIWDTHIPLIIKAAALCKEWLK